MVTATASLTFSLKYEAAPPSYPAHVLKPQQCDIDTQFGTTFPNAADVVRAYSGNQGHWGRNALLRKTWGPSGTRWPRKSGFWLEWKNGGSKMVAVTQNWAWPPRSDIGSQCIALWKSEDLCLVQRKLHASSQSPWEPFLLPAVRARVCPSGLSGYMGYSRHMAVTYHIVISTIQNTKCLQCAAF